MSGYNYGRPSRLCSIPYYPHQKWAGLQEGTHDFYKHSNGSIIEYRPAPPSPADHDEPQTVRQYPSSVDHGEGGRRSIVPSASNIV